MSRPKPKLRRKVHPQAVHRYLTLEFREELRRKAREYLIGADMVRRTDGTRFPKEITQDPLYVAIGYLRRRVYAHAQRQADLPPYDPAHAGVICRYILEAVSLDDFAAISDLAKLLEIQARGGARSKPKYIPWLYYAGTAALSYLDQGQLPSKQQVRNEAIRQRVLEELLLSPVRPVKGPLVSQPGLLRMKFEDVETSKQPRNWRRIFRELGLQELPA